MRIRGEFDGPPVAEGAVELAEVIRTGTAEQLDHHMIVDPSLTTLFEESLGVAEAVLPQISHDEDGSVQIGLDGIDVLGQLLRTSERRPLAAYNRAVGIVGSAAFGTVYRTPADSED